MVEGGTLLRCYTSQRGIEGSNPSSSAPKVSSLQEQREGEEEGPVRPRPLLHQRLARSSLLPIPRCERRATRIVSEARSSGSGGVHHADILVEVNIACILSREGYLLAFRRPGRRFEANLKVLCVRGFDEPSLIGAVGVHHVDVVENLAAGVAASQVGYLLAVGRPRGGAFFQRDTPLENEIASHTDRAGVSWLQWGVPAFD